VLKMKHRKFTIRFDAVFDEHIDSEELVRLLERAIGTFRRPGRADWSCVATDPGVHQSLPVTPLFGYDHITVGKS
jgi:hypothetical protein